MYADIEFFQRHIGPMRLGEMSHADETEQGAHYATLLSSASGHMDSMFAAAGYVVPIDPLSAAPAAVQQQLADDLAVMCATLAAWALVSGMVDAPEGLEKAVKSIEARLVRIMDGKEFLLGIAKDSATVRPLHAGRMAFVGNGSVVEPPETFALWGRQTLFTGGR